MDSLSDKLTPFDCIPITCTTHDTSAIGVCGENHCKERRFLCMKCIDSKETCISNQRHELLSLSELLFRFFIKQETKAIDFFEVNSMMENLKEIERSEIKKNVNDYVNSATFTLAKKFDELKGQITNNINLKKNSYLLNIEKTLKHKKIPENDALYKLLKINNNEVIPESITNCNASSMKEYISSDKIPLEKKQDCIKTVKILSDTAQLSKSDSMSVQGMSKFISKENMKAIENKVNDKLKMIEEKINNKLDQLEQAIIPAKDQLSIMKTMQNKFSSDPAQLTYKMDICTNAHKSNSIDSVFSAFKSVKNEFYVCWGTPQYTIEIYDLKLEKNIKTIFGAHTSTIFSCRHYLDKKKKRDLIISSSYDKSVKVWDGKENWKNIVNIQGAQSGYYIYSACILFDDYNNKNFIISASPNEYSKVFDFEGKNIMSFGVNTESTYFINAWYDTRKKKHYIINANSSDVKAYDFKTGELFKSYKGTPQTWHMSALVNEVNKVNMLIESDGGGIIRVWDFDTANMLKKVSSPGFNLRGICLWNDNYIFSSGSDYTVKLYDLKNEKFVKSYTGHTSTVCAVDKIIHPKYGECLISHALDGKLKLWTFGK